MKFDYQKNAFPEKKNIDTVSFCVEVFQHHNNDNGGSYISAMMPSLQGYNM